MYVSTRILHARLSRMGDALRILKRAAAIINEKTGTDYHTSVNLGNEPGMVAISARYEHLTTLEKVRKVFVDDADVHALLRFGEEVFLHGHENEIDHIDRIVAPLGDRKEWVSAKTKQCNPGMRLEAAVKGVEVANFLTKAYGTQVGFSMAITGNLNRCVWQANFASLAELEKYIDALRTNADYHALMKDAHKVFQAGTQVRSIWQRFS